MDKKQKVNKVVKNIAGLAFGIAFLFALVLFGGIGREYISLSTAKMIFIISGAIGLILNLISFQGGKHPPLYNLVYWLGSIILFTGIIFLQMNLPYGFYIVVLGLIILGASFFLPSIIKKESEGSSSEILDNFD